MTRTACLKKTTLAKAGKGGPPHRTTANHVHVEVGNSVSGIFADAEHESVAGTIDPINLGNFLGGREHLGDVGGVFGREDPGVIHVALRNDEHVGRCRGCEVTERERAI